MSLFEKSGRRLEAKLASTERVHEINSSHVFRRESREDVARIG